MLCHPRHTKHFSDAFPSHSHSPSSPRHREEWFAAVRYELNELDENKFEMNGNWEDEKEKKKLLKTQHNDVISCFDML